MTVLLMAKVNVPLFYKSNYPQSDLDKKLQTERKKKYEDRKELMWKKYNSKS